MLSADTQTDPSGQWHVWTIAKDFSIKNSCHLLFIISQVSVDMTIVNGFYQSISNPLKGKHLKRHISKQNLTNVRIFKTI